MQLSDLQMFVMLYSGWEGHRMVENPGALDTAILSLSLILLIRLIAMILKMSNYRKLNQLADHRIQRINIYVMHVM